MTIALTVLLCYGFVAACSPGPVRLGSAIAVLMFSIPIGIGIDVAYPLFGYSNLSNICYVAVLTGLMAGKMRFGNAWVWHVIWAAMGACVFGLLFRIICANPMPPTISAHVDAMAAVSNMALQVSGASFLAFGVVAMAVRFIPRITARNYLLCAAGLQVLDSAAFFPLAFWGQPGMGHVVATGAAVKIGLHVVAMPLFLWVAAGHGKIK